MGNTKPKLNQPKSVGLEANKPLIMAIYKPLPRFGAGCTNCK